MPGAFKLDHLQPIKPLLFPNFYTFFTFILGGQFLPQRAINGKREIVPTPEKVKRMTHMTQIDFNAFVSCLPLKDTSGLPSSILFYSVSLI